MTNTAVVGFYYLESRKSRQTRGEAVAGVKERWRKMKKHPVEELFYMCINFRAFHCHCFVVNSVFSLHS